MKPIKKAEYNFNENGQVDSCTITYSDGLVETVHGEYKLTEVQRQLESQQRTVLMETSSTPHV